MALVGLDPAVTTRKGAIIRRRNIENREEIC